MFKSNLPLRVEIELQVPSDDGENVHELTRAVSNRRGRQQGLWVCRLGGGAESSRPLLDARALWPMPWSSRKYLMAGSTTPPVRVVTALRHSLTCTASIGPSMPTKAATPMAFGSAFPRTRRPCSPPCRRWWCSPTPSFRTRSISLPAVEKPRQRKATCPNRSCYSTHSRRLPRASARWFIYR